MCKVFIRTRGHFSSGAAWRRRYADNHKQDEAYLCCWSKHAYLELSEFELVFEDALEIVNVIEVFYRIAGLCAHPLMAYH